MSLLQNKSTLLSIGDIAKLTRANIQSLRYYEKIGLLQPTFIDPFTGYRYYSFDQKCLIEVIQICIEMDIPLKNLTAFMGGDDTVNFHDLLAHGKKIAEQKLASIKRGLQFIDTLMQNVNEADAYSPASPFYPRHMPEKYVCILEGSHNRTPTFETIKKILSLHYDIQDYAELFHYGLVDIGVLAEHNGKDNHTTYAIFTELPKHIAAKTGARKIPAGTYLCTQSEEKRIEQAEKVFAPYIQPGEDYLVIETDIFTKQYKTNCLVHELRYTARTPH